MTEPMTRCTHLLSADWRFHLGDIPVVVANKHISAYMANKAGWAGGAGRASFDDSDWRTINVPHDWSVEGAFDPANHVDSGFLPRGIGWYRRHFQLDESERGKYLVLQFDGVASHCAVWVNGHLLHRQFCGYTPFTVEFGDVAHFGEELNVVAVRVDATPMEGWWYEGAGIYRDVYLIRTSPVHIGTDGVFVCPGKNKLNDWTTDIETVVVNRSSAPSECRVQWTIQEDTGKAIGQHAVVLHIPAGEAITVRGKIDVADPTLWSLESPALYRLRSTLLVENQAADEVCTAFGYRTIRFDPNDGFFLNDHPVKLKGTCNHQDHAGVGVAVPASIDEFRIRRLLDMGTNAYRCAHNPPSTALLDACDRLGMLVMDENRNFGSSIEHLNQLRTMVRRDRNHPCVILWSVCNEEAIQGTAVGENIARAMQEAVHQLDDSRPVTAAVSGGILNESGIGGVIEVMGINYQLPLHDQYHAKYPHKPLIAAETHCVLATRGTYETRGDEFSFASLDAEVAPWGASARETWTYIAPRPFIAGLFAWTGFDYRGEPTPHAWPCVNSHFGMMDTCGFPKDAFYLTQAQMTVEPMVHLLPHWNWPGREGQPIKVMAFTNCGSVELFLNGRSVGRHAVDSSCATNWDVPFEPGELRAVAYNSPDGAPVAVDVVNTTGAAVALQLEIHPSFNAATIPADGRFALPVTVFAVDTDGRRVPTAEDFVAFAVSGPAEVLGVGNGNPICHEPDKGKSRSLFHGLAQVIIQTTTVAGEIELSAVADGLAPATLRLQSTPSQKPASVPAAVRRYFVGDWRMSPIRATRPDPSEASMEQDMNSWDRVDPAAGPQDAWKHTSGYAIYRAGVKPAKVFRAGGGRVVFHEIAGQAEVFIDGKSVGRKHESSPSPLTVLFPAGIEQLSVSLVIHAQGAPAGITKRVELLLA
jgi:beta-galactosidase